jgi:mannan endo-1,4-beta-mannosidase
MQTIMFFVLSMLALLLCEGVEMTWGQQKQSQTKHNVGAWLGSDNAVFDFEDKWNVDFDVITVYRPIESVGYKYIDTGGKQLQIVTEMFRSVDDIANGHYDGAVRKLAKDIRAKGKTVWIRFMHEFNYEKTYPWCLYPFTNHKIAQFKKAWKRVVNIYREEKAPVKFQLCYQARNPTKKQKPYADFYPGDAYVDHVGIDVYVNAGSTLSLKERLDNNVYSQLVKFNKPIFIGEMSVTDVSVDKPKWLKQAWHDLAVHFPKITIVNFFLESKAGGRDWGLNTDKEKRAFVDGYKEYRRLT